MMGVNDRQRARRAFGYQIAGAILLWLQAGPALGSGLRERDLQPIAEIVTREVRLGNIPGAVVLIGHEGKVLYRRAFGYRALEPQRIPMTEDTIFDLASLTKVIATTTAVMQLVEQRRLRLEDSVARYWPEFGSRGKDQIRVRDLLSHSSGLRAGLDLKSHGQDMEMSSSGSRQRSRCFLLGRAFYTATLTLFSWARWSSEFPLLHLSCTAPGTFSLSSE